MSHYNRTRASCILAAAALLGSFTPASRAAFYDFASYPWFPGGSIQPNGFATTSDGVQFTNYGEVPLAISNPAYHGELYMFTDVPEGVFYGVSDVLTGEVSNEVLNSGSPRPGFGVSFSTGGATSVSFDIGAGVSGATNFPTMVVYAIGTSTTGNPGTNAQPVYFSGPGFGYPTAASAPPTFNETASQLGLAAINDMYVEFSFTNSNPFGSPNNNPIVFGMNNFAFSTGSGSGSGSGGTSSVAPGGSFAGISATSSSHATAATIRSGTNLGPNATVSLTYTGSSNFGIGNTGGSAIGDSFTLSGTGNNVILLDVFVADLSPSSVPPMLLWENPTGSGNWVPAYADNSPTATGSEQFANGVSQPDMDGTTFAAIYGPILNTPGATSLLGDYGAVYESGGWDVWMVIDHNSTFAVGNLTAAPEPALLCGMAMIVPLLIRRRHS